MTDQHTPEALSAEPWDSLPSAERLGQMVKSADLSMRDQFGRHRSRTGYYWRDMGVALHALLRNHPPLAATLDAARASRPEPKDVTPRSSFDGHGNQVYRSAPAAPEGLRTVALETLGYLGVIADEGAPEHDHPHARVLEDRLRAALASNPDTEGERA